MKEWIKPVLISLSSAYTENACNGNARLGVGNYFCDACGIPVNFDRPSEIKCPNDPEHVLRPQCS